MFSIKSLLDSLRKDPEVIVIGEITDKTILKQILTLNRKEVRTE